MSSVPTLCALASLGVTLTAAVTDARSGRIPDWLTLPPIVVAPVLWGLHGGLWRLDRGSLGGSLASMLLLALVPVLLFVRRAMGGGDVKLFAAVGALLLASVAIEAQLYAFLAGAVLALGRLAWRGRLFATLGNALFLALNPVLPRERRRVITPELMSPMRFGTAIFVGTAAAVATSELSLPHLL